MYGFRMELRRLIWSTLVTVFISLFAPTISSAESLELRAGVYENLPKIGLDPSGKSIGFWPEFLEEIARREDWTINWIRCNWSTCVEMLEAGRLDIMPDMGVSSDRQDRFLFNEEPVLVSWTRVYVSENSPIRSILDLEGKRIGVLAGSVNFSGDDGLYELMEKFHLAAEYVDFSNYDDALGALSRGEVDAAITNKDFGNLNESDYAIERTPIIFQPATMKFAFPQNAPASAALQQAIDSSLESMKEDPGSNYYQLLEKWLGENPQDNFRIPPWVYRFMVAAAILSVLLGIGIYVLRRRLRQREIQLRSFFRNSSSVIYMKNLSGRFELVNQALADLLRKPQSELIGKTDYHLFSKAEADEFRRADLEILAAGKQQIIEEKLLVDGSTRYYMSTKFPIRDEAGRNLGLGGVSVDYTEDRTERALKDVQKTVYDDMLSGSHSLESRLQKLLDAFCEAFGPTKLAVIEAMASGPVVMAVCGLEPDESDLLSKACNGLWEVGGTAQKEVGGSESRLRQQLSRADSGLPQVRAIQEFYSVKGTEGILAVQFSDSESDNDETRQRAVAGLFSIAKIVVENGRLERKVQIAESVYDATHDGMVIVDNDLRIVDFNPAFAELIGEPDLLPGQDYLKFVPSTALGLDTVDRDSWIREVAIKRADGKTLYALERLAVKDDVASQRSTGVALLTDITKLKTEQEKVVFLANHDALTELPNRRLLDGHINFLIEQAREDQRGFAVAFIDVDRFKDINDSLGHDFGDRILKAIARKLAESVRSDDFVARTGGDEFVAVLEHVDSQQGVDEITDNLAKSMDQPILLDGQEVFLGVSIGTSLFPQDAVTREALLRNADAAMYHAKKDMNKAAAAYFPALTSHAQERLALDGAMRAALKDGAFHLAYQPVISLEDKSVKGVEALIRWRDKQGKFISPADFIPVAEATGLIVELDEWVLEEAARQASQWEDMGINFGQINVNVSGVELDRPDFAERFLGKIRHVGVEPNRFCIEMTESVLMKNFDQVIRHLLTLKQAGVHIAIDDFGTGYSSLGYLGKLQVDVLKIDKIFVDGLANNRNDQLMCRTIIEIARAMELQVVAEGVETAEQAKALQQLGCGHAQGFLYARPMPADELLDWFDKSECSPESLV